MLRQFLLGCLLLLNGTGLLASPTTLTIDEQTKLPFWPSTSHSAGGLLLVQGTNSHAQHLLTTLAEILSKRGWSVAVVPSSLSSDKFTEQLSSYLAILRQETQLKIGIIWYGDDYHQLLHYFSQPQAKQVSGLVLISAFQYPDVKVNDPWQIRFPVLDIVGQFDNRLVIKDYSQRQFLFDKNYYFKRTIPGAGPDYHYQENHLSAEVDNWLTKVPSPKIGRVF
ncbi:hypothetical protein [Legionella sp. W05-934-2]|uniref:hypothetical protein n=1 Tax=Legionella sp. W05-934-2 TaxID=1198649 RepID=UPI003462D80A